MASLRRSLIHMDFLGRKKKKKDKRRNTVAEIESGTLKNIVEPDNSGAKQRLSVPCTPTDSEYLQDNLHIPISKSEIIVAEASSATVNIVHSSSEENNNTKSFTDTNNQCTLKKTESNNKLSNEKFNPNYRSLRKDSFMRCKSSREDTNNTNSTSESLKQPAEWTKRIKETVENRKKSRTNIPISTISAAMTVAVKMRQTSSLQTSSHSDDNQSSSGNWSGSNSSGRASSDSDDIKAYLKDKMSLSRDSLLSESTPPHDTRDTRTSDENVIDKERKESSLRVAKIEKSKDSNKTFHLVKSKSYSFDSDDDLSTTSYMGYNGYASSTSISTGSNESLNSLLSRTATELSGSTETLTSISKLPLPPPPPPPPPPRISSVRPNRVVKFDKTVEIHSRTYPVNRKSRKKENQAVDKKINSQDKMRSKNRDTKKSSFDDTKASKVTFSSILQKKFKPKENDKTKQNLSKVQKSPNGSCIDMYSGQLNNHQKVTILVNGNMPSPEKPKVQMHSFLPKHFRSKEFYPVNGYSEASETPSLYSPSRASSRTECVSPSSDMFSDSAIESSEESNVPLKYAPQITVMPLKRTTDSHQVSTSCFCNSCNNNISYKSPQSPINSNFSYSNNREQQQQYQQKLHPSLQLVNNYNMSRNINAAHVVLDKDGRVISSTNSLDRRLYNKSPQPQLPSSQDNINYQESCFNEQKHFNRSPLNTQSSLNPQQFNLPIVPYIEEQFKKTSIAQNETKIPCKHIDDKASYIVANDNYINSQNGSTDIHRNSLYYGSLPNRGKSKFINSYESNTYRSTDIFEDLDPNNQTSNVHSLYSISHSSTPTSPRSLLTRENVQQHSRNTNSLNTSITRPAFSPLSDNYCNSKLQSNVNKPNGNNCQNETPVKSMTAEDLFAIIHDSKKRLNIKTESDLSPTPSSSRSSSPSFLRQTASSKNGLAETGFLSPRGSYPLSSRDRRSWADFRPASERKSLASDRMGPSKPTSLHEFKMLLLQTRSNSRSNQRQSAVEQLKATSPNRSMDIAECLSPNFPPPPPLSSPQYSPSYGIYDGHLTVPLKRTHRSKGAVQPRYIMYPPIIEDCSEETENGTESHVNNQSKCLTKHTDCNNESWHSNNQIISDKADNIQSRPPKVHFANSSMWV